MNEVLRSVLLVAILDKFVGAQLLCRSKGLPGCANLQDREETAGAPGQPLPAVPEHYSKPSVAHNLCRIPSTTPCARWRAGGTVATKKVGHGHGAQFGFYESSGRYPALIWQPDDQRVGASAPS